MSKLVICEKPSVAQSIGKVLDASKRCDGYLEGGGYLVSWCVGHLVELTSRRLTARPTLSGGWRTCPSCRRSGGIRCPRPRRSSSRF